MKTFFKELFDYSHFCNQNLANAFVENADKGSEKSIKLFNHILNSHERWNDRIEAKETLAGVWDIRDLHELKNIDKANYENSLLLLGKFDFNKTIEYKNTSGAAFTNTIRDILFHVINHSTYHRAQIAMEFKQNEIAPLVTDYIAYKRK